MLPSRRATTPTTHSAIAFACPIGLCVEPTVPNPNHARICFPRGNARGQCVQPQKAATQSSTTHDSLVASGNWTNARCAMHSLSLQHTHYRRIVTCCLNSRVSALFNISKHVTSQLPWPCNRKAMKAVNDKPENHFRWPSPALVSQLRCRSVPFADRFNSATCRNKFPRHKSQPAHRTAVFCVCSGVSQMC